MLNGTVAPNVPKGTQAPLTAIPSRKQGAFNESPSSVVAAKDQAEGLTIGAFFPRC